MSSRCFSVFGSGGLLAADIVSCKAPGLAKQVRYLASSRMTGGPFSPRGSDDVQTDFSLVPASLSNRHAHFAFCKSFLGTNTFLKIYFILFFYFIFY